ncbi:MAG: GNAT family N-acetyltransferase, partial [Bacteroidales bacterium]|nr:GNAT family N-acetyltransferase [Bacteroidales bacterium]
IWEDLGLDSKERGDNNQVIEKTINSGGKFLVLVNSDNDEVIGTSWLTNDARRIYLHHFGIKKEYQNKGYAKLLLKASIDYAKEKKLQIKLEVHRNNLKAIELYKKYGFKKLGDYLIFIIREY